MKINSKNTKRAEKRFLDQEITETFWDDAMLLMWNRIWFIKFLIEKQEEKSLPTLKVQFNMIVSLAMHDIFMLTIKKLYYVM